MLEKCCFDESFRPPPGSGDGNGKVDSWDWGEALIDITAYMIEDRNHTSARCSFDDKEKEELQVTFRIAPPPHISYFCARGIPTESFNEPMIIAMDGNLALITLRHGSAHPSTCNYFVYRAPFHGDKPMLSRLPRPNRELFLPSLDCFLHDREVAILRYSTNRRSQQPASTPPTPSLIPAPVTPLAGSYKPNLSSSDDCDAYKIASLYLRFDSAGANYDLCTYDSKVVAWNREATAFSQPPPEGSPTHYSDKVITIGGAVGWVDLSQSILLCNVHAPAGEEEDPDPRQLRYIPLPERSRPDDHLPVRGLPPSFRDVAAVEGRIRLVDLHIHASPGSLVPNGWTAVTWSMALDDSGFTKESELHSRDIDGPLNPSLFVVHPTLSSQDGILYLMAQADLQGSDESQVISVNMKTKKLEGVAKFTTQRMATMNFAFKSTNISKYLAPDSKRKRRHLGMRRSRQKPRPHPAITFGSPNQPSGYGGAQVEEGGEKSLPSMGHGGDGMDLE